MSAARDAACAAAPAGVFLDGPQALHRAGTDGLVNTADDVAQPIETLINPGPDNVLGTADDLQTRADELSREIEISEIVTGGVANPNLRRLRVRVRYGRMIVQGGRASPSGCTS